MYLLNAITIYDGKIKKIKLTKIDLLPCMNGRNFIPKF